MTAERDNPSVVITPKNAQRAGQEIPVDELRAKPCKAALAVWNDVRGTAAFPRREQMTPRLMASFLNSVTVYAILDNGEDFLGILCGDVTVQIFGASTKGTGRREWNERHAGMGDVIASVNRSVARKRAPLAFRGWLERGTDDFVFHETLVLPLGNCGESVDHALAVAAYANTYSPTHAPSI